MSVNDMSEEYTETTNGYSQVIEVEDCTMKNVCKYIKQLQQENQQLKEQLDKATKQSVTDHKYASECEDKVITYKSVLDEIRECAQQDCGMYEIIKILDKVKE